jgi:lysozyme family protein
MMQLTNEYHRKRYLDLYNSMTIDADAIDAIDDVSKKIEKYKTEYAQVEYATSVPWFVIGIIHSMESGLKFSRHLHNGDPLTERTVNVPFDRPKHGEPPFTWIESAIDAIKMKSSVKIKKWDIATILWFLERYNGWGYWLYHRYVNSPYLWSKTNQYTKGKYVKDGKFDPDAVSQQIGSAALLKHMVTKGMIEIGENEMKDKHKLYLRGENIMLADNFHLSELECKCGCLATIVNTKHMENMQKLRDQIGLPIHVHSGFRCHLYNKLERPYGVGGVEKSQHRMGCACDITVKGMSIAELAKACSWFDGLGVYNSFIHVDSRGYKARW